MQFKLLRLVVAFLDKLRILQISLKLRFVHHAKSSGDPSNALLFGPKQSRWGSSTHLTSPPIMYKDSFVGQWSELKKAGGHVRDRNVYRMYLCSSFPYFAVIAPVSG